MFGCGKQTLEGDNVTSCTTNKLRHGRTDLFMANARRPPDVGASVQEMPRGLDPAMGITEMIVAR